MTTPTPKDPIRIVLIEDNPEYRRAITLAMELSEGLELVGKYGSAEQALGELQKREAGFTVDIVLLDLGLPKMQGGEAIQWIRKYIPDVHILVLTQSDKEADVVEAIREGAVGYILKSASMEQIRQSIYTVMEGGAPIDSKIAIHLLDQIQHGVPAAKGESELTKRELEVLQHMSKGLARKEIAEVLGIAENTVVTHIRHIYEKLQVPNAPAAISTAYQTGILTLGANGQDKSEG